MKKLLWLSLGLLFTTTSSFAADSNLRASMSGEKCVLVSATQDPANRYEVLKGLNAINIFGEFTIMQNGSSPVARKAFPDRDSIITLSFKNNRDKTTVGDQFFNTVQSTRFYTKYGIPTTANKIDKDAFIITYTHTYILKQPMREMTVKATHSIAQIIDHWASKDVVVEYTDIQKTPVGSTTLKGNFVFKCNGYESALDILR